MTDPAAGDAPRWSRRFLERLEGLGVLPPELLADEPPPQPAVSGLTVTAGSAGARVAASDGPRGYDVWVELPAFDARQWTRAEQALSADRAVREALLDGEVPLRVEAVLARAGLSLLPARAGDLTLECSCPAWSSCRHLVAVLAALADAFDADPFLLTAWRGRGRERLLRHVEDLHAATAPDEDGGALPEEDGRPLGERLDDFWSEGGRHRALRAGEPAADAADDDAGSADATATALSQLDASGVLIRGRSLESLLRPAYEALID
ncbi:hypothetical protein [Streptacidiphilus cavernicola]|uniref:SWIM-type domain-containing protein n=1 Tax=Streptacidiphilus cavernicola TaxID=3342716 RepID=A0ABV6VPY2_9ACTN